MQPFTHYALIGSVLAGVAGAVILALVTLQHGFSRRRDGDEESAERAARRLRLARVADTLAVLCFAVAATLGVMGLLQHARVVRMAGDPSLGERVQRLEARVGGAESALHSRRAPDLNAWEERLARLESRLGAMEERATVADRRLGTVEEHAAATDRRVAAAEERATGADRRAQGAERAARDHARETISASPNLSTAPRGSAPTTKWTPVAPPPAPRVAPPPPATAPRSTPSGPERPEASASPPAAASTSATAAGVASTPGAASAPNAALAPPVASAPVATTAPAGTPPRTSEPPAAKPGGATAIRPDATASAATAQASPGGRREPAKAQRATEAKPSEPTFREKLRQDWDAIKSAARRGGDEWREGWDQLRRAFTP
jgi:hypothetical protein